MLGRFEFRKAYIYVYTYTGSMATKTISIMDDAYEMLKALKTPEESFSDEIRRLTSAKGSIMEFAGAWKDISDKEAKKMENAINKMRRGSRMNEIVQHMRN